MIERKMKTRLDIRVSKEVLEGRKSKSQLIKSVQDKGRPNKVLSILAKVGEKLIKIY